MIQSTLKIFGGSISNRSYLSTHHLWGSYHLACLAQQIEDEPVARTQFNWNHRAFVLGSITNSIGFLEAAINEVYKDVKDNEGKSYVGSIGSNNVVKLKQLWKENNWREEGQERVPKVLGKYQKTLVTLGGDSFDVEERLFNKARLVVQLRNEVIHYQPETGNLASLTRFEKKLEKELTGRYPICKLFDGRGNKFFPDQCLGYGCCYWALDSVKDLADEFFRRVNIEPNYQKNSEVLKEMGFNR